MSSPTILAWTQVIARNIVPLAGILFLGWSAQNILILYFVDTLLSFAVLFAGVVRNFAPPVTDDGWAARANGEVGMVSAGVFLALVMAIPLGVPLIFMLGGRVDWNALFDPTFTAAIVWQLIAAFWSYLGLYRALQHASIEQLRLKRRFSLVFLRWIALLMVAMSPLGVILGGSAILFVALYIAVTIFAEIAPDRFLHLMPGSAEDAEPLNERVLAAAHPNGKAGGPRFRARRRERRRR
ncbi:MAG TPA: hypothetical protein VNG69_15145 [Casimicrobiaceae bacterium]|nr:hypothetical protein [Casimicrobiaceae bacterium]